MSSELIATKPRKKKQSADQQVVDHAIPEVGAMVKVSTKAESLLPFWPEDQRGIPNVFARSALFRVSSFNQKREWYEAVKLVTLGDFTIRYTGHELRQDDADLYLQILHLAKSSPLGSVVEFKVTHMLKALKRSVNNVYKEKLIRSLSRMNATAIEVTNKSAGYSGSLIQSFSWKDETGKSLPKFKITLDPNIINLFNWDNYTRLEWEQRMALTPLGKWLHYTYMSHKSPFPMKVETIMSACGSQMENVRQFKKLLTESMGDLVAVGAIESFSYNEHGNLVVKRASIN